jgi:hypothetical protein
MMKQGAKRMPPYADDKVWGRSAPTKQPTQVQIIERPTATALSVRDSKMAVWKMDNITIHNEKGELQMSDKTVALISVGVGVPLGSLTFLASGIWVVPVIGFCVGVPCLIWGIIEWKKGRAKNTEDCPPATTKLPSNWISNTVISLQKEFAKLKAKEELRQTVDLVNSYNLVTREIGNIKESKRFIFDITTQVEPLTKDVFRQGLLFLCSVRDFLELINAEDTNKLEASIIALNDSIDSLKKSTSPLAEQMLELKYNSLKYTQDRIVNLATNKEYAALLLARVEECDNILRITFDNLTKFSIEDSANSIDEIRHRLQNYIELAIEVRKEVNKACLEIT